MRLMAEDFGDRIRRVAETAPLHNDVVASVFPEVIRLFVFETNAITLLPLFSPTNFILFVVFPVTEVQPLVPESCEAILNTFILWPFAC